MAIFSEGRAAVNVLSPLLLEVHNYVFGFWGAVAIMFEGKPAGTAYS